MKVDSHGAIAPKSISKGDGVIYYLSSDGVRAFSGSASVVVSDKIRGTIQNSVNTSTTNKAVGVYNYPYYQLWVVEEDGATMTANPADSTKWWPDMALVYDPHTGCWTIWRGVYANCFGTYGGTLYLGAAGTPNIVKCQAGYDDLGVAINSYFQTGLLNNGVPEMRKRFHGLYSVVEATDADYHITVTAETERSKTALATRLTANEARQWDIDLQDTNDSLVEQRQTIALQGRYLRLKYSHEGANEPISVLGFTLEHRPDKVV
jgi:hypothetical protein